MTNNEKAAGWAALPREANMDRTLNIPDKNENVSLTAANPQKENGYVGIANELVDQLCRLNLSAYESRVLWALFRKTYGWNKKNDNISHSQFAELTGISPAHISRTLMSLKNRNLIIVSMVKVPRFGHVGNYQLQKNYLLWDKPLSPNQVLPNQVIPNQVIPNEDGLLPNQAIVLLPNQVITKDTIKTTNTKDTIIPIRDEINSSTSLKSLKENKKVTKKETDPRVNDLFELIKNYYNYIPGPESHDPIPSYGSEGKGIKTMLNRNFSVSDIFDCWRAKTAQKEGYCLMAYVNRDIKAWLDNGKKLPGINRNKNGIPGNRPAGAFDDLDNKFDELDRR